MGTTYVNGRVAGPRGVRSRVKFLVDSGAAYSVLPHRVWRRIGLTPKRRQEFTLADGRTMKRGISACRIWLPQGDAETPVVLGEPGDVALLGLVTLEQLGVLLNPLKRTIEPMRLFL